MKPKGKAYLHVGANPEVDIKPSRLTSVEQECMAVLTTLLDLMSAGHQKLEHQAHMELTGRVRTCVQHLTNKEYGCASGKHSGECDCREGYDGHSMPSR